VTNYGRGTRPSTQVKTWLNGPTGSAVAGAYQRPFDWLDLPTVYVGEQKIVGLVAVFENELNEIAFQMEGAYTVDWGDGSSPQNYATATEATHAFSWSGCPASTLTTEGFRQAIVTITPQAGNDLTTVEFTRGVIWSNVTLQPWLDIRMSAPNCAWIEPFYWGPAGTCKFGLLQRFEWVGTSECDYFYGMFAYTTSLRQVVAFDTSKAANLKYFFAGCTSLISIPALDLSSATDVTGMFQDCQALPYLPAMTMPTGHDWTTDVDMASEGARNVGGWFANTPDQPYCTGLRRVGALDLSRQTGPFFPVPNALNDYDLPSVTSFLATGMRTFLNLRYCDLSAASLDVIYGNLGTLSTATKTLTTGTAYSASTPPQIHYQTTAAHGYVPGQVVTITGASPAGYNVTSAVVIGVDSTTSFHVETASDPGAWSSGGTVAQATYVDVTSVGGNTGDTPTIATGKGWTVVG
jgi:hypothetical protein